MRGPTRRGAYYDDKMRFSFPLQPPLVFSQRTETPALILGPASGDDRQPVPISTLAAGTKSATVLCNQRTSCDAGVLVCSRLAAGRRATRWRSRARARRPLPGTLTARAQRLLPEADKLPAFATFLDVPDKPLRRHGVVKQTVLGDLHHKDTGLAAGTNL